MSRTLSIDKIGPGPGFLGQALPLSQPSCGDLGVSLRRSSLQFNIRPWRISALGNPLLRLGLPRSIRQSRVAGGALGARRKRAWGSPQRPRIRPQDGMDRAMSGRPSRRPSVLDHAAYRPAPACELAGRCDVGLVPVDAAPPASPRASSRAFGCPWPRAFSPRGRVPGPWPGPSGAGWRLCSATRPRRARASDACCRPW